MSDRDGRLLGVALFFLSAALVVGLIWLWL